MKTIRTIEFVVTVLDTGYTLQVGHQREGVETKYTMGIQNDEKLRDGIHSEITRRVIQDITHCNTKQAKITITLEADEND